MQLALRVHRGLKDTLAHREHREHKVPLEPRVLQVLRELQELKVLLAPKEPQVLRVGLVVRDHRGILVQLVIQVCLVKQAHKVQLDKDLIFEVHTLQEQFTMSTL